MIKTKDEQMRMKLDLIKEAKDEATIKEESYKRKVTNYYNKRMKNK